MDPVDAVTTQSRGPMPLTRAFLFADLRGYTDFVEANGDAAAQRLLTAYRKIVREVTARYHGAEIRTEGDSFYLVFDSASGAVQCGLEIVAAAEVATAADAGLPIRVGVGIHVGESAEDGEGYVGLAVNIAARICAQAHPGEVLVSETVRTLTRSSGDLVFTPRGRRQLKGVSEPIALFSVGAGAAGDRPLRRTSRDRPAVGTLASIGTGSIALLIAAVLGVAWLGSRASGSAASPSPRVVQEGAAVSAGQTTSPMPGSAASVTPSSTVAPLPVSDGMAPHVTTPPGTYRSALFEPTVGLYIGTGWEATADDPDLVELRRQTTPRGAPDGFVSFARVRLGYMGSCETSPTELLGTGPEALVRWLQARKDLHVSAPVPVNLAGTSGLQMDVTAGPRPPTCPDRAPGTEDAYYLFQIGSSPFFLTPGETARLTALDVGGATVLLAVEQMDPAAADFDREVTSLLTTLTFP